MKPYLILTLLILISSTTFAQIFGRNYNTGTYYGVDGQKHEGLLAMDFDPPSLFSSGDNTIFFKTDTSAKKQKIKASTIKGFIVSNKDTARTDSFVIVHNPKSYRIKYAYDITQVINDSGPVKLYNYRLQRKVGVGFGVTVVITAAVTYYDNYYFYGPDPNSAVEMKKKDFKDVMSKMLADDMDIVAKIQNGTYTMGTMHKMITEYHAHKTKSANL